MPHTPFVDTPAASKHIKLSVSMLTKLRCSGDGPKYFRLGRRVVYSVDALDAWVRSREYGSTSEYGTAA